MNKYIATITNLAYIIAGLSLWSVSVDLVAPALFLGVLGLLSAAHHWWNTDLTKVLDYLGMYLVGISIFLIWLPFPYNLIITFGVGILLAAIWRASRVIVGTVIFAGLVSVFNGSGFLGLMITMFPLAVAWVFNYSGDNVHREHHETYHGVGWHTVSAFSCMVATGFAAGINILSHGL